MASGQAGQDAEPKKTLAEIENERITRRAALRKFGFGAGMAAIMALSVDELARMAAVKLQQNAGDNQVANAVAKEFRNVGVAFADDPPGDHEPAEPGEDTPIRTPACQACLDTQGAKYDQCYVDNGGVFPTEGNPGHSPTNTSGFNTCTAAADAAWLSCWQANHCAG